MSDQPNGNRIVARSAQIARTLSDEMEARPALTRSGLMDVLEAKLRAKRTVFATSGGIISDQRDVDDHTTQLRALNMALTLRNEYPSKQLDVSLTVAMEQLPVLSQLPSRELLKLAGVDDGADDILDVQVGDDSPVS